MLPGWALLRKCHASGTDTCIPDSFHSSLSKHMSHGIQRYGSCSKKHCINFKIMPKFNYGSVPFIRSPFIFVLQTSAKVDTLLTNISFTELHDCPSPGLLSHSTYNCSWLLTVSEIAEPVIIHTTRQLVNSGRLGRHLYCATVHKHRNTTHIKPHSNTAITDRTVRQQLPNKPACPGLSSTLSDSYPS